MNNPECQNCSHLSICKKEPNCAKQNSENEDLKNFFSFLLMEQSKNAFKNSELAHRERVKEKFEFLSFKATTTNLTQEEFNDFTFLCFLVNSYKDNPL